MRRIEMDSAIRRVRDVRLALAGLLVLSMAANLMLTMSFAGRETVTVLMPATAGPAWEVGGGGVGINRAGARYLEDMARTVAVTLLTLTPENAGHDAPCGGPDEPCLGARRDRRLGRGRGRAHGRARHGERVLPHRDRGRSPSGSASRSPASS